MDVANTTQGGLAAWLIERFAGLRTRLQSGVAATRELRVVETISLGGRRQVTLLSCGNQRFLVGCGADHVQTIVHVPCPEDKEGAL